MDGSQEALLSETLTDVTLGLSVSDSPDLPRLGLLDIHLRLALAEVTRAMLLAGAHIMYGGHLDPQGYTSFLEAELERYGRRDRPLIVCLAWPEHRRIAVSHLAAEEEALGLRGRVVFLDAAGEPVSRDFQRTGEPQEIDNPTIWAESLTGLREYMTAHTDARLLIGGRREGFKGRMPGVLEEALLAISLKKPVFLAGGFGGVTLDVAKALGVGGTDWLPALGTPSDPHLSVGLEAVVDSARVVDWRPESNGLDHEENLRLAASHRPSEVASLLAVGLRRLRSARML